jgi:4-hydroxy-tetrahydrodipicolinate reductase
MKLAVAGAAGRMGRVLARVIRETPRAELAGALEQPDSRHLGEDIGTLAGFGNCGIRVTADAIPLMTKVDGIIDFTVPAASIALSELAAQARIVHVIGTTGIDDAGETRIRAAARHARIVKSGNMSLGVNLLAALVRRAAASLGEEFDIEIVEMHHRHKVDAPSGTALLLGQAAARGRNLDLANHSVRSRDGHTGSRVSGTVGFATLRGGTVVGEHSVIFAGPSERIELSHRAESRDIFALGAVRAAFWAMDRKPGLYTMMDVLGLE